MKKYTLLPLLFFSVSALAVDVKISQLPLGDASATGINDSFPFVDSAAGITRRVKLSDLIHIPSMAATYAPKASPVFTGAVIAPLFIGSFSGTTSGNLRYTPNKYGVVISDTASTAVVIPPDASTAKVLISGGTAANPSWGVVGLNGGGTGATTKSGAFNALSPMSTLGDIIYGGASGTGTRLGIGSSSQALTVSGGIPAWATLAIGGGGTGATSKASAFDALSPLSASGDLLYGGASGTGTRLPKGSDNQVLVLSSGLPTWATTAIASGGTGATTKSAGFDALSPMSASGDVIYGGASGTGTRLAKGSDGQVLTLASGLPSWAAIPTSVNSIGTIDSQTASTNGLVVSGSSLVAQSASSSRPGLVNNTTQTLSGAKTFSSVITASGGVLGSDGTTSATAGNVGEAVRSYVGAGSSVTCLNATPITIASISLTAGDWDVSGVGIIDGILGSSVIFSLGIGTTTNSLTGINFGDNGNQTPTAPTASSDSGLTIPSFRVLITSTTTYYLITQVNFSIGTCAAYGRISARRVR